MQRLRKCALATLFLVWVVVTASCGGGGSSGSSGSGSDPATDDPDDSSGTGASTAGAEACFSEGFLADGAQNIRELRSVDSSTGEVTEVDVQRIVLGTATFDGQELIELDGTITRTSNGTTTTSNTTEYFELDTDDLQYRLHALFTTSAVSGVTTTIETKFEPPRSDRFDLVAGDDYTEEYTLDVETVVDGTVLQTSADEVEKTRTYLGRETITVPAGTIETCKFRDEDVTDLAAGGTDTSTTTRWFDVGTGLEVRQETGTVTEELVSGTQNGNPIE